MANEFFCDRNKLYLSYAYLKKCGVTEAAIKNWVQRKTCKGLLRNGLAYLNYDEIPLPTQKKLPRKIDLEAEYNGIKHEQKVDTFFDGILYAHQMGWVQHNQPYKDKFPTLDKQKIRGAAQLHAVWQYILDNAGSDCLSLYNAFNKVYPGKYKSYNSFANAKSKAVKNGAEFMAIDQRWFTARLNIKEVSVVNKFWAASLISIGKKYSNRTVWKQLCWACEQSKIAPPSLSWVDKYRKQILKRNFSINESRNGKSVASATQLPFATMKHALFANDQWQMDGWTLPFYVHVPNLEKKIHRFTIVLVRDAHSKKIIGSAVDISENTTVILAALKKAIINTGCLPYEILTDNHSFNQTKEAAYFKDAIAKIGTQYTVTHSPTHKSIIERYNRHLDTLCKAYYGYLGEGVKSKSVDGRPKQEMLDDYLKHPLSEEYIKMIGVKIVEDFNNNILPKEGKTPNQLFEESEKPNCFPLSVFDRAKILLAQNECKVTRGQITIKRGFDKHEYQLSAEMFAKYNNETVTVHYEDLNECIYVFEKDTEMPIAELKPKAIIHGALANQNEDDIELLNKSKGRLAGIKSQADKANEKLRNDAQNIEPNAYILLNKITTPKDILKEVQQDADLQRLVEIEGVNLKKVVPNNTKDELEYGSFKPRKKVNDSPFQPPKDHKMIKIPRNKPFDYD